VTSTGRCPTGLGLSFRTAFSGEESALGLPLLSGFARHGRFRLCLLFFPEFGVTGFPAVGDLGQELADDFDFAFGPEVKRHSAAGYRAGSRDFLGCDIATKRSLGNSKLPGRFSRRD
jgi:hypothetical protein